MNSDQEKPPNRSRSSSHSTLRRLFRDPLVRARRKVLGKNVDHQFAVAAPSPQQTVDIFAGQWVTAFPADMQVQAGSVNHFDQTVDPRVSWVDGVILNGLAGKSVLELGPFEAYQTALLEWAGTSSVLAVEASRTAFLKCLTVKELLNLKSRFLYGDVHAFLDDCQDRFDLVWASGILYHQVDPIGFLTRAAAAGNHLFLHTHYFDHDKVVLTRRADRFIPAKDTVVSWHGRDITLHYFDYASDTTAGTFAGGPRPYTNWLTRADIEFILTELGFTSITYGVDDPGNPAGPAFFLLASRT